MVDGAVFMTSKDLAVRWALSERRIRDMAAGQEIPSMRVGKVWRFPVERIAAWERANTR
ncbi:MAG: DNA-binding protein [Rhodococcus sp. (in: high G+C Gram-positive bacteria)]|nr:MAG: DNA-binding protein [Rhodococcus sp. (in: high G+C Gram-positive bacteria)]